jgi:peptidoglycan hydrolase-like protein with peptidoglycan-binding domain
MSPHPIAPWQVDRRFPVRSLQHLLRARGRSVVVDGIFGPRTEAAVEDFQRSEGLASDGIVGPRTWPRLVVQVRRGSTADAVRAVQEVMKFHDQSNGEGAPIHVDGMFGPRTDKWVRGFQKAVERRPTGSSARSRGALS